MRGFFLIIFSTLTLFGNLIPRDVLFSNPDKAGVTISPDGKYLAYKAPFEGVMNVWIKTIGKDDDRAVTKVKDRPVAGYFWTYQDSQLIFARDYNGDENMQLFLVDISSNKVSPITEKGVMAGVLKLSKKSPDELLILTNKRDPAFFDVYHLNTKTLEKKLVYENKEGFSDFVADENLNLKILSKRDSNGGLDLYFREKNQFTKSWHYSLEDADQVSMVSLTPDGKTLYYLDAQNENTASLKSYNFESQKKETVFASRIADIQSVSVDSKTNKPQGCVVNYLKPTFYLLDDSLKEDLEVIKTFQKDKELAYISKDLKGDTWALCFYNDKGPAEYWLYDCKTKKGSFLFTTNKKLEGYDLVSMQPVVIKSRDGLDLVSYLSRPKDQQTPGPMVLFVHGGPWVRDSWGYHPYHQWLVNRGYSVLSVNYRGSTGFGKHFLNAGNRQWAKKMQDDLIDAVNWAINTKIADPKKVAIMGGSYGGYATLVGLTFTPDVFALGVDIVGPSHIKTLLETVPPYWKPMMSMFEARVGSLSEPKFLDEISPLTKVDNIKKPLLILQGKNDPRVKEAESEQIVKAMQEKSIDVTYVVFPDEGHGFRVPENNIASNAIIEKFLAKHLGGKYQEIKNEVKNSSAQIVVGKDHLE